MYREYNNNPKEKRVGDCVIRAISTVLNQDWERTYIELALQGFVMSDMPSANSVWGAYLRSKGLRRSVIPNNCPDCYTVREFAKDHPTGRYLVFVGEHVIAVIDGDHYDTWDSGDRLPIYYWS